MRPGALLSRVVGALSFVGTLVLVPAWAEPDALALMEKSRQTSLVKGSRLALALELHSASGAVRVRKVSSSTRLQSNGIDNSRLTRFEYPPDAKGLATLIIEHSGKADDVWVYVPGLRKTRRVVADGKRDSFMGTVLSYGDVIGHRPAEWTHRIVGVGQGEGGRKCWHIESLPRHAEIQAESGYSKRLSCVDAESGFAWTQEAWDPEGKPLKRITNRRVRAIPEQTGTYVPHEVEAVNLQTLERSIIVVERFQYVANLPDSEFKPAALSDAF